MFCKFMEASLACSGVSATVGASDCSACISMPSTLSMALTTRFQAKRALRAEVDRRRGRRQRKDIQGEMEG